MYYDVAYAGGIRRGGQEPPPKEIRKGVVLINISSTKR